MKVFIIVAFVVGCVQITPLHSRTSALWRLNDNGKITPSVRRTANGIEDLLSHIHDSSEHQVQRKEDVYAHDEIFYIIASTLSDTVGGGGSNGVGWVRQSPDTLLLVTSTNEQQNKTIAECAKRNTHTMTAMTKASRNAAVPEEALDCGTPVNFTYYDYLIGIGHRFNPHPLIPEPDVAYLFLKTKDENAYKNFDIKALERRLRRNKRERPRSVQLYNQIGNYWRIKGDARQSIECFRRALAMSPTNAEVLLNLARVLYNLQYLDDAIHLTRRSLEMQPPGRSAWQQYFALGEIFKAYGHFQESLHHLRHALELQPHHEPILKALRNVEDIPPSTVHVYTVVIIVALVVAVFVVIITSSSSNDSNGSSNSRFHTFGHHLGGSSGSNSSAGSSSGDCEPRRHFNRAMAMRSLKGLGSSSRQFRHHRRN